MATMIPCGKGHFYNPDETSACPYCGIDVKIDQTRPIDQASIDELGRTRPDGEARQRPAPVEGVTVPVWNRRLGNIDPVVGWLVCIEGPDCGRDYRIHTEQNFIGRAPTMDIAITGDPGIGRDRHAMVSYNPKRHSFRVSGGESRGLVYVNEEEVLGAVELHPYDVIELGVTKLLFIPLCGERFTWPVVTP
jgi:hypothetical protein